MRRQFREISLSSQLQRIKSTFPNCQVLSFSGSCMEVVVNLHPKPFCEIYDVKICYSNRGVLSVYVINKKLKVAVRRKKLPHVYNHEKQELCLFSYKKREWTMDKSISSTIIPWASEWLYFYELWLINGDWLGGGHDEYAGEKEVKNEEKF